MPRRGAFSRKPGATSRSTSSRSSESSASKAPSFPVATIGGVFAAGSLVLDSLARIRSRRGGPARARRPPGVSPGDRRDPPRARGEREAHERVARARHASPRGRPRGPGRPQQPPFPRSRARPTRSPARLEAGGRWFYAGAGTSGRLGALDAAELPPTFGTDPSLVVALLAGGRAAMFEAVEGAEDDAGAGARDLARGGLAREGRRRRHRRERRDRPT